VKSSLEFKATLLGLATDADPAPPLPHLLAAAGRHLQATLLLSVSKFASIVLRHEKALLAIRHKRRSVAVAIYVVDC